MHIHPQRPKRSLWIRWLIVFIALLLIGIGTILWIVENQGPWITILPIVLFTVLSVLIALFQWLFPVSNENPPPLVHSHAAGGAAGVMISPPQPQQIVVQMPPTISQPLEVLPPVNKTVYRSIIAVPPPTDPRTIQQREKAVKEVYTKLIEDDITAIVLTGIGGVGKSTLAALVYRYAEEQRRSGDGPFFAEALWLKVDSSAVSMTDLVCTIFAALDRPLPDLSNLAPHNQAATLFNALNNVDEPRLIVLDQFENLLDWQTGHALPDRPGVGEWLDAINSQPCHCRILLTSRPRPLGVRSYPPTYMQEYHVQGLEVAEGRELLQKLQVRATREELDQAVTLCGGHAFALTLLASLLRNRGLSLGTFFKSSVYAQVWNGDVARNLLNYIYLQQLDQLQRNLLLAFSIYREPVPLDAARVVADAENEVADTDMQYALDALLTQHLLQLQSAYEGHYQPHLIIISYARDHFDTSSEAANRQALQAAHMRAARYYQEYAAMNCPPRKLRRQLGEIHPLLEAIWHLCQANLWTEAHKLIYDEDIYSDLYRWGSMVALLEVYRLLLPLEKWQPSPEKAARFYNELGRIYWSLGRMEHAREYYEWALSLSRVSANRREEAWAISNIGRIYADLGSKQKALEFYEDALKIHKEVGRRGGESTTLTDMGWVYYDFGEMDQAREYYEQALSIRREINDRYGEASALNSLGRVYANLEQLDTARRYHEEALAICREVRDRRGEGWSLNSLGRVYHSAGQKEQARHYLEKALEIRREIGDRRGEAATLSNLGLLLATMDDYEQAMQCYEQALPIRREVGNRSGEGKTFNYMGLLYSELGQYHRACRCFKQALAIRRELGHERRAGKTLNNLGICYRGMQRYDVALACFLLAKENFTLLLTVDRKAQQNQEITLEHIDQLCLLVGEEQFADLLKRVEPNAAQILEDALKEEDQER
jgi:tetratricopeptide (TPR) repeat protein